MTANLKRLPSGPIRALIKAADDETSRRVQAMKAVLGATALGLGGGAATRGLIGLGRTIFPSAPLEDSNPLLPRQIEIPVVRQVKQDEEDRKRLGLEPEEDLQEAALARKRAPTLDVDHQAQMPHLLPKPYKFASAPLERLAQAMVKVGDGAGAPAPSGLDTALSKVAPYAPDTATTLPGLGRLPSTDPAQSAAYIPLILGGGAAGIYGGWKLTDWLLRKNRRAAVDAQLEKSKQDYRKALNEQYEAMLPPQAQKTAGALLDQTAEAMEKRGWDWPKIDVTPITKHLRIPGGQTADDWTNRLLGTYATVAGMTALGTGVGAYNWSRNRSEAAALEKALRQRRLDRAARPAPVMAVAKDVSPEEFAQQ